MRQHNLKRKNKQKCHKIYYREELYKTSRNRTEKMKTLLYGKTYILTLPERDY